MIKINICDIDYEIDKKTNNLLDALVEIKKINKNLGFSFSCKSGVCGSCAIRVNGVEKLACTTKINNNDKILPLKNLPIIKDLIVNHSNIKEKILKVDASLNTLGANKVTSNDVDMIDKETNCILCNSCYSSCPVYEVNDSFIGPFALVRAYKYIEDKKESSISSKLDNIQSNGIWDCTLCGACDLVCPANISIKDDIMKMQNISVQNGYENPAFSSNSGFDSFDNGDFGFNPNGF